MTYKFVFDPHAGIIRPVATPARRPRRKLAVDVALIVLALVASSFGFAVVRAAMRTPAPSVGAAPHDRSAESGRGAGEAPRFDRR
ncbi:MAG: hypothetical protein AB1Z98_03940 [Nannocystaceae bacterium]